MKKNKTKTGYSINKIGLITPFEWIILNSLWYIFWGIFSYIAGDNDLLVLQDILFIITIIWVPFMIFATSFYYKNRMPISNILRREKMELKKHK